MKIEDFVDNFDTLICSFLDQSYTLSSYTDQSCDISDFSENSLNLNFYAFEINENDLGETVSFGVSKIDKRIRENNINGYINITLIYAANIEHQYESN